MIPRNAMFILSVLGCLLPAAGSCAASPFPPGRGPALRDRAAGYELTVLVDGVPVPSYTHDGDTYVLGQLGARYTLRVSNHSDRRIEAVVSVDGRDAIDGRPADFRGKRGYLVPAGGSVDIDGWRISRAEAAAFRFSSVANSYAARTGSAREVGVIGVAIFPERYLPPPIAYPAPVPYAAPRDAERSRAEEGGAPPAGRSAAPSASAEAQAPQARPGLGTEYGEAVSSPIYEVEFARANPARPAVLLGARYNDRDGLLALGIPVDGDIYGCGSDADLRRTADPFPASDHFAAPPAGWRRACEWR